MNTYNPNLEEDIKLWLASPEDLFFQQSIYLPLLNYVAGILLRLNPTSSQDDALTYLADVVARLPKYDAGKGCTVLSFVRNNIQWMYGERLCKSINHERLAKFQSIYNNDGEVDETVCGITEPITTEATERQEEYQSLLKELVSILTFQSSQPGRTCKTRQAQFETELLKVLANKSNGYTDLDDNCGLFGCKLGKYFRHKDITKALVLVRRKVRRSKEKTQAG